MSGPRRPRRPSRLVVALGALALLLVPGRAGSTEAAWVDRETTSATLTAAVIPPVTIVSCTGSSGLLGLNPTLTIVWKFNGGGYSVPANIEYYGGPGGLLPALLSPLLGFNSTTGPVNGEYTSTFGSGLLTGLLGGKYTLAFEVVDPSGWRSVRVGKVATFNTLALAPASCADA